MNLTLKFGDCDPFPPPPIRIAVEIIEFLDE